MIELNDPPFIILALPRSRTAWLAHFLSYGGKKVGHDIAIECKSVADFQRAFDEGMDGTVETGAVLGWRLMRHLMPGVKLVTVRRDPRDVIKSLAKFGLPVDNREICHRDAMLDLVAETPGSLNVLYDSLVDPQVCKVLFEFCLDLPFDWEHWTKFNTLNIQVDMQQRINQLYRNHAQLEKLKSEISLRTASLPSNEGISCLN